VASRLPRTFQPSEPPRSVSGCNAQGRGEGGYIPWRALSSENSLATSSNLAPLRSFSRASSFLENFSH
jgi:hypothetical protein